MLKAKLQPKNFWQFLDCFFELSTHQQLLKPITQTGERFALMYEVLLHPDAQKVYINADKALAKKIARCLQQLEQTPRSHLNIKVLKGDYRVIYSVDDDILQVFIVAIPHRSEAYEP
jgi:mRNA interferase RelE/StbE